jgi:hypothetical protein
MSASSDDSSESGSVATGFTGASHASSASSASAASNSTNDAARLAERIHCKLCSFDGRDLPVKSHRSAVNAMVALRALLLTPIKLGRNERMLLLYAGISIQRRKMLSDDQNEVSDLEISLVLLFVLQLLCEAPTVVDGPPSPETDGPPDPTDPTDPTDEQTLEKASTMSLTQQMEEASTKKTNWDEALHFSSEIVCRSCLGVGNKSRHAASLTTYGRLAELFFRNSSLALKYSMLSSKGPAEDRTTFLTLGSMDFLEAANDEVRDANLAAIVAAGESEVGQQSMRDLILSFTLPPKVVGVRRFPLLSREANNVATAEYTALLGDAHETAMAGAEWVWSNSQNTTHRMCALLAGLCILLAGRGSADHVRKSDCFRGRVLLPFLETTPPNPKVSRVELMPHNNQWVVYRIEKHGEPVVQLRASGFEGLCDAALLLAKSIREGTG